MEVEMKMEWLTRSIGRDLQGGKLPSVPEERRLEESLFPLRVHPRYGVLNKQLLSTWGGAYGSAWAKELEKMRVRNVASFAAYLWPNATNDVRAITLIKLLQWFILLDDIVDDLDCPHEVDKLCHRLIHHIFGCSRPPLKLVSKQPQLDLGGGNGEGNGGDGIHAQEPLLISVGLEWWREIQASSPPKQQARIAAEITQYALSQGGFHHLREKLQSQERNPPGLVIEEYILARRVSSGFFAAVSMIEYDLDIELDEETLKNPLLQKLQEAVCDHSACINDILSFPKEFANGEMISLLPLLHMRNNHEAVKEVSFQEAVSQAWQMAYAREQDVAGLAQELLNEKPGLEAYVEAACSFSSGNWAWSLQTPRYSPPPVSHSHLHLNLPLTKACMALYDKPFFYSPTPNFGFSFSSRSHVAPFGFSFRSHPHHNQHGLYLRSSFPCLAHPPKSHLSKRNLPFLSMPLVHLHSFKNLSPSPCIFRPATLMVVLI